MSVASYMRERLLRAGIDRARVDAVPFGELCVLANMEFGEDTLRNWGVWNVAEPYLKAAA